jgi:aldehyde dehydrogenase (NAD+)
MHRERLQQALLSLGILPHGQGTNAGAWDGESWAANGSEIDVISPTDGQPLARLKMATKQDYERLMGASQKAFQSWREVPAPRRGEIVRLLGEELRRHKEALATLVTMEMGKCLREGLGEVQEMIDICDMACGQARMLYGVQTHSERARHRMYEQWHPLGVVGVISAFNFPVAVWSWNTSLALICGDTVVWKPASPTPLTAIACTRILDNVLKSQNLPRAISTMYAGKGSEVGELMIEDHRVPLVSYTGSTPIGRHIGAVIGERLGRTILELGGNNAVIVTPSADLELACRAVLFGAIGTAGQRCTSTRRVIVHKDVKDAFTRRLLALYEKVTIGHPLDNKNLMGPLVNKGAVAPMMNALKRVPQEGGKVLRGGELLQGANFSSGCYVTPAVAEMPHNTAIVQEETFAPILYIMPYEGDVHQAIALQNGVPQGLSSSIFSNDMRETEAFLSAIGSDCGIANVNTGTSGAEIGLAFGGEKETGGGRESGSDAWKTYMRRQSNTMNWSGQIALAQGITFE